MTLRSHCALVTLSILATIALVTTAEVGPSQEQSPLFVASAKQIQHLSFDLHR
ncbi:MAG: hypothetical protein WBG38_20325 [Nodosilinea sp.]